MSLVKKQKSNEEKIALVGLGYVVIPIAVELSKNQQ